MPGVVTCTCYPTQHLRDWGGKMVVSWRLLFGVWSVHPRQLMAKSAAVLELSLKEFKIRSCFCVLQAKSNLLLVFILPVSKKNSLFFVSKNSVWEYKISGSLSLNKALKHSHFLWLLSLSWYIVDLLKLKPYVHWVLNSLCLTLAPQCGGPKGKWGKLKSQLE